MSIPFRENGFTIFEFLFTSLILLVFLVFTLPAYLADRDAGRESELKDNLHRIQIALERYAVDNGEYPAFLLGGDRGGWSTWHKRWDGVNDIEMPGGRLASNDIVRDPLLHFGYLVSYPTNPFVDDGGAIIRATNMEGTGNPGEGDPRFGYLGDAMGMGLDDLNFFRGAIHPAGFPWSEIETRRTLDCGDWMNVPDRFKSGSPFGTGMYYLFGGFSSRTEMPGDADELPVYWPGNFFYKSASDVTWEIEPGWSLPYPNTNSVSGDRSRYILGCYGSDRTEGFDVIRLIWWNPYGDRVSWRCPEPFEDSCWQCGYEDLTGYNQPGGLPEVFGGGDQWSGPWWYYNKGGGNEDDFIYGAPDGVNDGVILVLTDEGVFLD